MLPSHTITAVHIATLDLGHQLGRPLTQVIGGATFTGKVEGGVVTFDLDALAVQATDRCDMLLRWIEERLSDNEMTLAGYRLARSARYLKALPGARWSSALRAMNGRTDRPVVDFSAHVRGGPALDFHTLCRTMDMPCAAPDETEFFTAWCTGRVEPVLHALAIDVIATWRLAMGHIAERTALGARVHAAIEERLIGWLRATDLPAAQVHLASLESTAD